MSYRRLGPTDYGPQMTVLRVLAGIVLAATTVISIWGLARTYEFHPDPDNGPPVTTPLRSVFTTKATERSRVSPDMDCRRFGFPDAALGAAHRRHSESAPSIAVNPVDPTNVVIATMQGRAPFSGFDDIIVRYSLDTGHTWNDADLGATRCGSAAVFNSNGDHFTAQDARLAFDPAGNLYMVALGFNFGFDFEPQARPFRNTILLFKSTDKGQSWSRPIDVATIDGLSDSYYVPNIYIDPKGVIFISWSAEPFIVGFPAPGTVRVRSSIDGGLTWRGPALGTVAYTVQLDAPCVAQLVPFPVTWDTQMKRYPDNSLLMMIGLSSIDDVDPAAPYSYVVVKSLDDGLTWTAGPCVFDPVRTRCMARVPPANQAVYLTNPATGRFYSASQPQVAFDPTNDNIYLVHQENTFIAGNADCNAVISVSKDRGLTWSVPVPIHDPSNNGMQPLAVVAADHTVGVFYYSDRFNVYADGTTWLWDAYIQVLDSNLNRLGESRLTPASFDIMVGNAQLFGTSAFGYQQGLVTTKNEFYGAFHAVDPSFNGIPRIANTPFSIDEENRQDIHFFRASRDILTPGTALTFSRMKQHMPTAKKHLPARTSHLNEQKFNWAIEQWDADHQVSPAVENLLRTRFNMTLAPTTGPPVPPSSRRK